MKKEVINKELDEKTATEISENEPPLYEVFLHNDDYTPMEFVVGILQDFFYMDRRMATEVMLRAHMHGKATCGLFSKDYAESKVAQVIEFATKCEHPLICSMETA